MVAERGDVTLVALIALVWIATVTGDLVSFLLGRKLGRPFLERYGPRLRVKPEHIDRVERLFEHHGATTIVTGRFIGVLRALTPCVAGTSGLPLRRFLPYSAGGALIWATTFTLIGYLFSSSFASAGNVVTRVTLAGAVLLALAVWAKRSRRPPARPARAGGASRTSRRPTPA